MPDREKTAEELRELRSYFRAMAGIASSEEGRLNHMKSARTIEDAIILLKAQESRVLTVDEVRTWVYMPRIDREPIWVEIKNGVSAWIVSDEYYDMPIDENLSSDLYGNIWRCWTSRPTDEQRQAVKWE